MLREKLKELQPKTLKDVLETSQSDGLLEKIRASMMTMSSDFKDSLLSELKKEMGNMHQTMMENMGKMKPRDGMNGKDGMPGMTGMPGKDGQSVDMKMIEALIDEKIKKQPQRISVKKGGGGGGTTVVSEDLSSQCNGTTKTFTTTKKIGFAILLSCTQFPTILRLTTDYTASGNTVTLNSSLDAPASGQTLIFVFAEG